MKVILFCIIILFSATNLFSQLPSNLEEAVAILEGKWSDSLMKALIQTDDKYLFREFGDDSILISFILINDTTEYQEFFQKIGVDRWSHVLHITLDALKRDLQGLSFHNEDLVNHYKHLTSRKRFQEENPTIQDTLNGIFIPQNIKECILQLHLLIPFTELEEIKSMDESAFAAKTHLTVGMWIRNNWGLWKGSRLSIYFNENGVYEPDSMSWIIFLSFHRHLKSKYLGTKELFEYYSDGKSKGDK